MMPGEAWQTLSMANALLVADGLMTPEEVRCPAVPAEQLLALHGQCKGSELIAREDAKKRRVRCLCCCYPLP